MNSPNSCQINGAFNRMYYIVLVGRLILHAKKRWLDYVFSGEFRMQVLHGFVDGGFCSLYNCRWAYGCTGSTAITRITRKSKQITAYVEKWYLLCERFEHNYYELRMENTFGDKTRLDSKLYGAPYISSRKHFNRTFFSLKS